MPEGRPNGLRTGIARPGVRLRAVLNLGQATVGANWGEPSSRSRMPQPTATPARRNLSPQGATNDQTASLVVSPIGIPADEGAEGSPSLERVRGGRCEQDSAISARKDVLVGLGSSVDLGHVDRPAVAAEIEAAPIDLRSKVRGAESIRMLREDLLHGPVQRHSARGSPATSCAGWFNERAGLSQQLFELTAFLTISSEFPLRLFDRDE